MCKKKSKQISALMILFIFILGMYFDLLKADSSFLYVPGDATASRISSVAPVYAGAHALTAEMPGAHGHRGSEHFTFRLSHDRWNTGPAPDFLFPNIICLPETGFCSGFRVMQTLFENHVEIVTNYIHKSDGKKRIS